MVHIVTVLTTMVYLVFQYYCYTCVASYIVANYVLIYYNTLRLIRPRKVSKLEKPKVRCDLPPRKFVSKWRPKCKEVEARP